MNHDLRKVTYDIITEFEKNKSQLKLTRDRIVNKAELCSKDAVLRQADLQIIALLAADNAPRRSRRNCR